MFPNDFKLYNWRIRFFLFTNKLAFRCFNFLIFEIDSKTLSFTKMTT